MQPTLKGTYKGYEIEHGEFTRGYIAKVGGSDINAPNMEALCRKIDAIERKDFKRTTVVKRKRWGGGLEKAEITSHADNGDVWTINGKGEREKVSADYCYLDTEDTAIKLRSAADIQDMIEKMKAEQNSIIASIERYKIAE